MNTKFSNEQQTVSKSKKWKPKSEQEMRSEIEVTNKEIGNVADKILDFIFQNNGTYSVSTEDLWNLYENLQNIKEKLNKI